MILDCCLKFLKGSEVLSVLFETVMDMIHDYDDLDDKDYLMDMMDVWPTSLRWRGEKGREIG